ncbi:MAG: hypothetical protein CSA76_01765 [Spirochaetales bacterium]|nr:MAG: hypothetical protein CSA76_01765 [Spirochaetales bacterium]
MSKTSRKDGLMEIVVNPSRTRAELILRREEKGGKPLKLEAIAELLRKSRLADADGEEIKAAIVEFWKSRETEARILLAEGTEPERGPDRELLIERPFLEEEEMQAVLKRLEEKPELLKGIPSLKAFPLEMVSQMAAAEAGQIAGKLAEPQKGAAGKSVYGEPLEGLLGNDPVIHTHEGLEWESDNLKILADGLLDMGTDQNGAIHLRVRRHRNALIQINITEDKLKAFVSLRLPEGTGAPASSDAIHAEAEKAGIVKGFLEENIMEAVDLSLQGEIVTQALMAEGRLPMKDDNQLSLNISGDPAQSPIPVKTGELIGTMLSDEDMGGWNILGEPLKENSSIYKIGENILKKDENGFSSLSAEKGGFLIMKDGQLFIQHIMKIEGDVSTTTGNINFPGIVQVQGSILSKVVVQGAEGVEVSEVVQAALVTSSGDIQINKGIKGEHKAVIRTGGSLKLGYAEEANLLSTGNIQAAKTLMNCMVKCNGKLELPPDGRIIGGTVKVKEGLVCGDAGNEKGSDTLILFGQNYLIENQIEQVQNEVNKIKDFIKKTDEMMEKISKKPDTGNTLIMIRQKKLDAVKLLRKKKLRIIMLEEKFEEHFDSAIEIQGTAWPGVIFESHGRQLKVEDPLKAVRIIFNKTTGQLEKTPIK